MTSRQHNDWTSRRADIVIPRHRDDLVTEELDDEVIVYDPQDGATHRFNPTALEIWRQCDGQVTTRQMAGRLREQYDIDFETALDHVDQLLVSFAELHLFETPCS